MPWDIDIPACRGRQRRMLNEMERLHLDLVVVTQIEHVQYLAGPRFDWKNQPAAALAADGRLTLVAPRNRESAFEVVAAADDVVPYEAQWLYTLRNDQRAASSAALIQALAGKVKPRRIGVECSTIGMHLSGLASQRVDIEPLLYDLRRRKDADELAKLRTAIAATGAMYAAAREIVRPGANELDVFSALQAAAVRHCGEMLTGTGNDYACAVSGGPPRDRAAQAGELYILDLGPAYRGYFADNCRTISVDRSPTDLQMKAWESVAGALKLAEKTIKPGVSCRDLYEQAAAFLREPALGKFDHHLGHGIGLFPHEAPHLNPEWDDTLAEGDVVAVEPGLYAPELRGGIRLENDYLVTADGVELLSPFPLEL